MTAVSPAAVSAPGKIFLVGEYAVLAGGTAVVAAVDRRVTGRFVPGAGPSSPLVAEAVRAVRNHLAQIGLTMPDGAPQIDSSALSSAGGKLGLGSSAAAAAVAVGALLEAAGRRADADLACVFELAERAHRAAQGGRGSGADVAVAVWGGVVAFARPAGAAPAIRPLGAGPGEQVLFSAGAPRATVDGIRAVEALAARAPDRHAAHLREIGAAAQDFLRAWEAGDGRALIEAARSSGSALAALGRSAEIDIWTDPVRAAAALAAELGGTAKPSGAGGGDVGVAFFADAEAAAAFRARAPRVGLAILNIVTGAGGLARAC
jgi:phosphomevalonate kinase